MPINTILIFVLCVILLLVFFGKCSENYGQDASIRAAVGWAAGPNYGFDPVQIYADQIEQNRRYIQELRKSKENEREGFCGSCS